VQILKAIIVEENPEIEFQFRRFEAENSVIFLILEVVRDTQSIDAKINNLKPDLVILSLDFLEIDFNFLSNLNIQKPKLIVTSTHSKHAFEAFKQNAVDFLIKPLQFNAVILSLYKTIKLLEMEAAYHKESMVKIKTINTLNHNLSYVAISSVDKIELLKINDIVYCKADGKYTEFYTTKNEKKVSSRNLGEYMEALGSKFFRIHHSYVINIKFLVKIVKKDGLYCELVNNHFIPVAKRRQEEFLKFINL
jgi:two-component system LytT family response regulator